MEVISSAYLDMVYGNYIVLEGQYQSLQLNESIEIDLCSFSLEHAFISVAMRKSGLNFLANFFEAVRKLVFYSRKIAS